TIMQSGHYRLTSVDLSTHFDEDMIVIGKYIPSRIYTAIYEETKSGCYFIKRFLIELTDRKVDFVGEEEKNRLVTITADKHPRVEVLFDMKQKSKGTESEEIIVHEFIGVKGYKAKGKRLTLYPVKKLEWLEPLQIEEPDLPVETEDIPEELPVDDIAETEVEELIPAEKKDESDKKEGDTGPDAIQMELEL
ncbi:MAG TPA: hypothetical protein VLR52_01205, partial [Bacteroidales bacterium]|nr:hypothetical protein [Bacteroidales bacterium]